MLFWIILGVIAYAICGLASVMYFISKEGYGTTEEMVFAGAIWPIMLVWYFFMDSDI